jgi:ketosteroid isomerase-like protein
MSNTTTTTIPKSVRAGFEAFNAGDPEPLIALYADRDVLLIGTDEDSYLHEPAAIAQALCAEAGNLRADWDLRPQPLGADVQLLTGRISFILSDGTVLGTRATYVLRRDHDDWRIVHSHLSIAQGR